MKGRRSRCRGTMCPSRSVGAVDRFSTGWAIQLRGSAVTWAAIRSNSVALACGPMNRP